MTITFNYNSKQFEKLKTYSITIMKSGDAREKVKIRK
jgi:hypothetical protein